MSLLPSFFLEGGIENEALEEEVLEFPKEFGINFSTGELTGEIVEGLEAIKVWIWLTLQTERYQYPIYPWSHGVEFEQYVIGQYSSEYIKSAMAQSTEEALFENEHIVEVSDFNISINKDKLTMSFRVNTDLGEVNMIV